MARSALRVEVRIDSSPWRKAWPRAGADIKRLVTAAGSRKELKGRAQGVVDVLLTGDKAVRALNAQFRGKDGPTNVLSFPDSALPLGGIALAFETIGREAREQRKHFVNHAKHMILHGFLHLLGYDHEASRDARLMEGLEIAILSDMGIPNPYFIETKPRA